jgi:hypothetical protein
MIDDPKPEEFPGTGDKGNKMPETMKSQAQWVDTVKNMCQSCHALGTRGIREIPKVFTDGYDAHTAWAIRTQAGQAQEYMATVIASMGPDKVYDLFSKWTDHIAGGELPFAKPERPKGIERNVVYTMWDWAAPTRYQHDAISTDKRNPRINANGLIYGSSEESSDLGWPHQYSQRHDGRGGQGLVHGTSASARQPRLLQARVGFGIGQGCTAGDVLAPALAFRSRDEQVGSHQHLLHNASPLFR